MAAGLGFKTFAVGEVLSAANVNGYLMQGVLVFANATARDAAITSPQEGQFAYLKDTNVTTYYTGSAWANLDTTGMTNPMTTTGDTIYSSSGSTPARLGIGTAGQVLRVNSGATAPEWATVASGSSGLTLVKTQTIGSAVTSVTVTDAFSSTYDNYLITINGGVASNSSSLFNFTLGATTSGYSYSGYIMQYTSNTITGSSQNAGSSMFGGYFSTNSLSTEMVLQNPFLSKRTIFSTKTAAAEAANYIGNYIGFLDNNTSYTAFTFTISSGNVTGGTIRVYGYQNS
jgi:hypothetical protein